MMGLFSIVTFAQDNIDVTLQNTDQFVLESSLYIGEPFTIQVCLPKNYDQEKYYPLVILLDADKSIGMAKDIADWLMFRQEIQDIIICGIAYNKDDETWWINRSRDFCPTQDSTSPFGKYWPKAGSADKFLDFIEVELLQEVGKRYNVKKGENGIIGFSFGGLLASYSLFTRPSLFKNCIIISPALIWDNMLVHKFEEMYARENSSLNKKVFFSLSSEDSFELINDPTLKLIETLIKRKYSDFLLYSENFEGETHFSGYPRGMTTGLLNLYKIENK